MKKTERTPTFIALEITEIVYKFMGMTIPEKQVVTFLFFYLKSI